MHYFLCSSVLLLSIMLKRSVELLNMSVFRRTFGAHPNTQGNRFKLTHNYNTFVWYVCIFPSHFYVKNFTIRKRKEKITAQILMKIIKIVLFMMSRKLKPSV